VKVDDLDRLVDDALREDADRARLDQGRWRPSVGGGPRRRFPGFPPVVRRSAVAAIAAAVVIAGIAVPLAILSGLRGGPDGAGRADPPAEPGYETARDLDDGISIRIPADWTFREDPTQPIEPKNVLAVGTWAFPSGGVCEPFAALRDLPDDGAFLWLIEYHGVERTEDFIPRPERFELGERYGRDFTCSGIRPAHQIRFHEGGRYLQLQIAFGDQAPASLEAEVLKAVDSLEIEALPLEDCPSGVGPWSHPACPAPAWVRAVVEEAGFRVVGDTGSALVAEADGIRFYIHTTNRDDASMEAFVNSLRAEGYEPFPVDYYPVLTDGTRVVWKVDGLAVWMSDNLEPLSPAVVDRVVAASLRVDYRTSDATL